MADNRIARKMAQKTKNGVNGLRNSSSSSITEVPAKPRTKRCRKTSEDDDVIFEGISSTTVKKRPKRVIKLSQEEFKQMIMVRTAELIKKNENIEDWRCRQKFAMERQANLIAEVDKASKRLESLKVQLSELERYPVKVVKKVRNVGIQCESV